MSDAIPGISGVGVAGISLKIEIANTQIAKNLFSFESHEWSDTETMLGEHSRETYETRSSKQIHKKGFGLIIHLVSKSNSIEVVFFCQ